MEGGFIGMYVGKLENGYLKNVVSGGYIKGTSKHDLIYVY